ncbi:MAG: VOC family protein [Rhodobacteraceae bacterium]|nr:VOC family protein [Paracoccaceae bacterium]
MITFDHLAVTAPSLPLGLIHVQAQTGLVLPKGGEHPQMATHNAICRFSDSTYLEIITPNPEAEAPAHPRWFNLDHVTHSGLSAWIVRTDDIERCIARAAEIGINLGSATALKRDRLQWRFSLRDDGTVPLGGAAPLIIQWDTKGSHPASNMPDLGMELTKLHITTPRAKELHALLDCLGMENPPEITQGEHTKITASLSLPRSKEALLT